MKYRLSIIFAATLFLACNPQKQGFAQQPASSKAPNLVSLETSGCRGFCPIYKLDFRTDGTIEFEGIRFVEQVGKTSAMLTKKELESLKAQVKNVNLWQYQEQIPTTVVDGPAHKVTVYEGDKTHSVTSSAGTPQPIQTLQNMMKDFAESHGLRVKQGVDPNAAPLTGEVLVKFKPEVNAGNFCMQFMEIKVRPVRRVSTDNVWVIGFNPKELTESQFINILKSMDDVVEAQPNKKASDRN